MSVPIPCPCPHPYPCPHPCARSCADVLACNTARTFNLSWDTLNLSWDTLNLSWGRYDIYENCYSVRNSAICTNTYTCISPRVLIGERARARNACWTFTRFQPLERVSPPPHIYMCVCVCVYIYNQKQRRFGSLEISRVLQVCSRPSTAVAHGAHTCSCADVFRTAKGLGKHEVPHRSEEPPPPKCNLERAHRRRTGDASILCTKALGCRGRNFGRLSRVRAGPPKPIQQRAARSDLVPDRRGGRGPALCSTRRSLILWACSRQVDATPVLYFLYL